MSDEYVVVWAGRGPIIGMSSDGWTYRGNVLLDMAQDRDKSPWFTKAEQEKIAKFQPDDGPGYFNNNPSPRRAGRPATNANRTRRCHCGRKKQESSAKCTGCRRGRPLKTTTRDTRSTLVCLECASTLKPYRVKAGVRRCDACRARGPYQRKAA